LLPHGALARYDFGHRARVGGDGDGVDRLSALLGLPPERIRSSRTTT
jgi:hypothetical protein